MQRSYSGSSLLSTSWQRENTVSHKSIGVPRNLMPTASHSSLGVQLNSTYWPTLVMGDPNGARLLPFTCPDGFVDITYGAPKIWECGAGCMLGPYTDGVCCCACQPAVCISGAYVPDTCVKNNVTCGYIKSYACAPAMWALRLRPGR